MKKQLYVWHRRLGIVVCIPLMLWALSGICHPLMNWVQPDIATDRAEKPVLRSRQFVPLHEVLERAGIRQFENVRLVYLDDRLFYQVRLPTDPVLAYLDISTGQQLENGDERYAEELARHFLGDTDVDIVEIELLESFTSEYREINRLLPVYRVAFDRNDSIRLFVETGSSRLGTSVDRFRGNNQALFWIFHNFGFLNFSDWLRVGMLFILALTAFFTGVGGIVIFGFTKKPPNSSTRSLHRYIGIGVSAALLMFSSGAAVQIWSGLSQAGHTPGPETPDSYLSAETITEGMLPETDSPGGDIPVENGPDSQPLVDHLSDPNLLHDHQRHLSPTLLVSRELPFSVEEALAATGEPVEWTLAAMNEKVYHRVEDAAGTIRYLDVSSGEERIGGEEAYALHLARGFGAPDADHELTVVREFGGEYGFVNKRLPVVKIAYETDSEQTWYIETWTGQLAAAFESDTRFSGMLFIMLHKWHFLDPIGIYLRDIIMITFCLLITVTAGSGLWIFLKKW